MIHLGMLNLTGEMVTTDNNFYYLILAKVTFPTMER